MEAVDLCQKTCHELVKMIKEKEVSSEEVVKSVYSQIEKNDRAINGYIKVVNIEESLEKARLIDNRNIKGEKIGALAGIPIAIKDNICTIGINTTCASKMLENFTPPYDATVIKKLKDQDAIIVGKTNMDEFAMGSSTENSYFGPTKNPWDLERVPGGTSGGSAAVVASDETILGLGSDTGGSIRQPASFCGVVGIKPTYGLVSRYGLIAYASSLDQIGALTKDVGDAALLLSIIAGHDPMDSTSLDVDIPDYVDATDSQKSFRIGIPEEYFGPGLDDEVRKSVENAIDLLKEDGHSIITVSLPHTEYSVPAYYVTACSEASSNLARHDGVRYGFRTDDYKDMLDMYSNSRKQGFGDEVKRRIILGTYALSSGYYDAYYLKAAKVRTLIAQDFQTVFKSCDVIAHPVAPTPAYKICEKMEDPLSMYLGDIYSVIANLVGIPAVSIPCGLTKSGLPIGIQLTAKLLDEPTLFAVAKRLEYILNEKQVWKLHKSKQNA